MNIGMIVTFAGIIVAALAGVLGVWMERDREAPPRWAWVFSAIILVAMFIEMGHSIAQASEDAQTEEAMVRVLEQLTEIAAEGNNPALEQFVGAELAMQARANPGVMNRLEKTVEAKGGDASSLRKAAAASRRTAAGLPASRPARSGRAGMSSRPGASSRGAKSGRVGGRSTAGGASSEGSGIKRTLSPSGTGTSGSKSTTSDSSSEGSAKGRSSASSSSASSSSKGTSSASSSSKGGGKSGKGGKGGKTP